MFVCWTLPGHLWLQAQMGRAAVHPTVGWQIDPFGHTTGTAFLFAKMGHVKLFAPRSRPCTMVHARGSANVRARVCLEGQQCGPDTAQADVWCPAFLRAVRQPRSPFALWSFAHENTPAHVRT